MDLQRINLLDAFVSILESLAQEENIDQFSPCADFKEVFETIYK